MRKVEREVRRKQRSQHSSYPRLSPAAASAFWCAHLVFSLSLSLSLESETTLLFPFSLSLSLSLSLYLALSHLGTRSNKQPREQSNSSSYLCAVRSSAGPEGPKVSCGGIGRNDVQEGERGCNGAPGGE